MPGQSRAQHDAIKRIGLAVAGSGGVSGLGTLLFAVAHGSSLVTVVIVAAVIALVVLPIALPSIITAIRDRRVAIINAATDAQVTLEQARQRTNLMNAGLAGNLEAALALLRLQPFDTKVIIDPRCGDDVRRQLLPEQRTQGDPGTEAPITPSRPITIRAVADAPAPGGQEPSPC